MLPAHYKKKESSYFCRFTFGQFFTLLVLEIFTLFFIFYLGARYGRELLGISSTEMAKEMRDGLPEVSTTEGVHVATTSDPEIKALAKDLLESSPTPDLKQRVADMLRRSQERKGLKPKKETRAVFKPKPKPSPKPEPVIQTAPIHGRYTIQVGSFNNSDEAHMMVNHWKGKGYPAYLLSADIPGKGRWYRVRLGGFETREEADVYMDKFKDREGVDAFVADNL